MSLPCPVYRNLVVYCCKKTKLLVFRTDMAAAEFYPNQRKVIQYVAFADDVDSSGHGTHVAGIAAGKVRCRCL